MKTVIIDDNAPTRKKIRKLLEIYAPDLTILDEAEGVETGFVSIQKHQPDLVLLDVEMGDGTGFDLISLFDKPNFIVIFITAHDGYAIRAFQTTAIGYVLKPIDAQQLLAALRQAKMQRTQLETSQALKALLENRKAKAEAQQLILSDAENFYLVPINNIMRCESESNYTRFFLQNGEVILIAKTMKAYEEILEGNGFFRVHRSHLVNLQYFNRLDKKEGGTIYLKDGSKVPVAVRRKDLLLEALGKL